MTKVFKENKVLCLTPEAKFEKWRDIIIQKAKEGNKVKLYADTETTGLNYQQKGRPAYDPQTDKKMLMRDAMNHNISIDDLEKESMNSRGKIDRLIEYAFVACYTNPNGETFLLRDEENEPIFFHEMINPNRDNLVPEEKTLTSMPLIPYNIHKTSFGFLEGKEEHPFLNVTLPHEAPSTKVFMEHLVKWFDDYKDDEIFDNIYMFFHNGDDFDVPFIDAELKRATDGELTLRDLVQTYDTLKIVKNIMPSDVQKFISKCQNDPLYGGDASIKDIKEEFIQPTGKNLDNIVRLAKYLNSFDPNKPEKLHMNWQRNYAKKIEETLAANNMVGWDSLKEYASSPSLEIDYSVGSAKAAANKDIKKLLDGYKKFRVARTDYDKSLEAMNKHSQAIKNLFNLKETINNTPYISEALERLHNTDRSAHGARVDSQLFMDALIVIEGAFYPSLKVALNPDRKISLIEDIKLSAKDLEIDKKKVTPSPIGKDSIKSTLQDLDKKYNKAKDSSNKIKNKI